jgi:hypothetical protein
MSQAAYPIFDADGHITESIEQVAKYLDAPYNRRPLNFSFYPWDGWDRRLLGTLGDSAGTADAWLRALDLGGMEQAVSPTLGLFLSFLKDREWAVALCRAYNTFLHEEFVEEEPALARGRAAARAGSRRGRARAAPRGDRARAGWAPCSRPTAATCWGTRFRLISRKRTAST